MDIETSPGGDFETEQRIMEEKPAMHRSRNEFSRHKERANAKAYLDTSWEGWGQEESHVPEGKWVGSKTKEVGRGKVQSWDFILITHDEKSSGVSEMGVGGSVIQSDLWCKGSIWLLYRKQATEKQELLTGNLASSLLQ